MELITKRLGKIAVITGGSSGVGLATAQRFVQEGAYVFITGRGQSEVDKAIKQIGNLLVLTKWYRGRRYEIDSVAG